MGKKVGKTIGRAGLAGISGGLTEFAQKNPFGVPVNNPLHKPAMAIGNYLGFGPGNSGDSTLDGGSFSISPEEIARDNNLITGNASTNSGAILQEGMAQDALRKQRRTELADLLTGVSDRQFMRAIPGLAEDANSKGIYTGTGFSDSLARERAMNTQDVQDQLAQQALGDLDAQLGFRTNALGVRTGGNDSALSRQFSLEDFIRSANVAKTTGQALQPRTDNGKAGTGAVLSGLGSLAPLAGLFMGGPAGAAAGTGISSLFKKNNNARYGGVA